MLYTKTLKHNTSKNMMKQYLEEREKDLLNNFAREHFYGLEYDELPDDVKDRVVAKIKKHMLN